MFNLKKEDRNLKGELGELIARYRIKNSFKMPKWDNSTIDHITNKFKIDKKRSDFLKKNKLTIDLIRLGLDDQKNLKDIFLYEVKLFNFPYQKNHTRLIPITSNTLKVLKEAKQLGFIVQFVRILLFDDWRYNMHIYDFDSGFFRICEGGNFFKK